MTPRTVVGVAVLGAFAVAIAATLVSRGVAPAWLVASVTAGSAYGAFVGVVDVLGSRRGVRPRVRNFLLIFLPFPVLLGHSSEALVTFFLGATLVLFGTGAHDLASTRGTPQNGTGARRE